jgi:catechol 2,3-dioxygenase-like lactoylglutathione lyase family enzyme
MHIEAIDHVILPVESLAAAAPFERLGLRLTPPMRHANLGTENRVCFTGSPGQVFYFELLATVSPEAATAGAMDAGMRALLERTGSLALVMLRVADMGAALAELAGKGLHLDSYEVHGGEGQKICDVALLPNAERAGTPLALVAYTTARNESLPARLNAGLLDHAFPLKRLDHLAAIAPDLDAATRFWADVLGVPVFGEVKSPTTIIRQMKMGDAIFELLGPATPDSPLSQRPPGLISMVAMEVPDLEAAVQQARAAGFTTPDPATGVLPGTRTASIPATELSGLTLQLLEYV